MKLLNAVQIQQKVNRLAIEILENNCHEEELILAGINNNGMAFAELLHDAMIKITLVQPDIKLTQLKLNPANPIEEDVKMGIGFEEVKNKVVIVIDDVANSGRTLQYAMLPILKVIPKKIELAVLVDRTHKSFPVSPNYMGMQLNTTLKNNIDVKIRNLQPEEFAVYLN
jgi:pyrimidine operon attenuation protein/uracil phosphoribosyltransferase